MWPVLAIGVIWASVLVDVSQAGAVGSDPSTLVVSANPTTVVTGQPITLSASVSGSFGAPTGTVTFFGFTAAQNAPYTLCAATVVNGTASCQSTSFMATVGSDGPDQISALYSGDSTYAENNQYMNIDATLASTTITLESSANPTLPDSSFTITANVSVNSPGQFAGAQEADPNIYVQFQISGYDTPENGLICDGPLTESPPLKATCSFDFPAGTYVVTAQLMHGDLEGLAAPTPVPIINEYVQPPAHGYWLVGSDGGVFTFGSAAFYGSTGANKLQRPVVGITPTADDAGYWLVASDGGVFSFGDSRFFGSIPGLGLNPAGSGLPHSLNAPIAGIVPSIDDKGYFMVASDGGVFAFGDAKFEGSCPGIGGCSGTAVAVTPDTSGNGYWLVTATGNVYAFGDAPNYGGLNPKSVSAPVTAAARTPDGNGYWVLLSNGGVFTFGDATFHGACGTIGGCSGATVAIIPDVGGNGYWLATAGGNVYAFGDAVSEGSLAGTRLNGAIIAGVGW